LRLAPAAVAALVLLAGCGAVAPLPAAPPTAASSAAPAATATTTTVPASAVDGPGPAPTVSVLYRSDWSSGLDGWSGSDGWTALRGELLCDGRSFDLTVGVVAPLEIDATADFAVEAEIRLLRYEISNGSFGVMARVQEDGTGYAVGHDAADEVVVLRSETGGGRPVLDRQPFDPGEDWHTYRLEVRGNELRAFVDGGVVLGATDNRFLTGRRVGLWSSGAQLSVRRFEVGTL
jgi:hypothetical protein